MLKDGKEETDLCPRMSKKKLNFSSQFVVNVVRPTYEAISLF